ncbi:hypothetical protein [Methanosphaera stadtmanae]|uniref:hypothetical protein n=1 Tax=Methanosphaera stadtmanae TaxID=2317 RepID=UPI00267690A8|nr:hypothetical protein [Methanosphaera stadtmanae]
MSNGSTIRVSIETKKRLNEIGNVNDSYNSVIEKLLDAYDKNKNRSRNQHEITSG